MNKSLLSFLLMISIFLYSVTFFTTPFEGYISYFVYLLLLPLLFFRYGINRTTVIIFLPLLVSGILYILRGDNTWALFTKVFIGFFTSVLFYSYIVRLYNNDIKALFRYYMIGATVVSAIGIYQIIMFWLGINFFGYNLAWFGLNKWTYTYGGLGIRINSVFSEPSYFGAVIAPAFFVSLHNMVRRKKAFINRTASIMIIITYLLTFSSVAITGVFISIILLLLNYGLVRQAYIFAPIFYFSFTYAYNNLDEFRDRFDGTLEIFSAKDDINTFDIHGSSFVLYNNYYVAKENFKRNPLFGTGLGSHPIAFDKYSLTQSSDVIQITFNKADANSMFLRLLSETGLYGVSFILYFLLRHFFWRGKSADDEYWIMSSALGIIIVLYLLRQGHYFLNGFPFFLWMYYHTWKINKEERLKNAQESDPEPVAEIPNLILRE